MFRLLSSKRIWFGGHGYTIIMALSFSQAEGTGKPSLLADLLRIHEERGGSPLDQEVIKGVTATAYAGEYTTLFTF